MRAHSLETAGASCMCELQTGLQMPRPVAIMPAAELAARCKPDKLCMRVCAARNSHFCLLCGSCVVDLVPEGAAQPGVVQIEAKAPLDQVVLRNTAQT